MAKYNELFAVMVFVTYKNIVPMGEKTTNVSLLFNEKMDDENNANPYLQLLDIVEGNLSPEQFSIDRVMAFAKAHCSVKTELLGAVDVMAN